MEPIKRILNSILEYTQAFTLYDTCVLVSLYSSSAILASNANVLIQYSLFIVMIVCLYVVHSKESLALKNRIADVEFQRDIYYQRLETLAEGQNERLQELILEKVTLFDDES